MTIKKLMMGAGAVDGPQVIAPSSNDWDYTFAQNEWPVAGNPLGDGTIGGNILTTGGDSGLYSLVTFDGDFEIEFTLNIGTANTIAFGLHELTEDDLRAVNDGRTFYASGVKSYFWNDGNPGGGTDKFWFGNTNDGSGSHVYASGDVVKITRESGTIKFYDGASVAHTFSATSSNPVRFWFAAGGSSGHNIDNILFTDTDKIQRDGFINETKAWVSATAFGEGVSGGRHRATEFVPTRTGGLEELVLSLYYNTTAFNCTCKIYTSDGTNPVAQLGTTSAEVTFSGTGEQSPFVWSTPVPLVKGTKYWYVFTDVSGGSGVVGPWSLSGITRYAGSGRSDTITSITGGYVDMAAELKINTSAGEPTPDHDTLLLIHSDTTDGSTTFVDSSQFGRTVTVGNQAQHDTAQKKFGASSILYDGDDDYISVPDAPEFAFASDFTIECHFRLNSLGTARSLVWKGLDGATAANAWRFWCTSANKLGFIGTFSDNSPLLVTGATTLVANRWYHAAAVRVGATISVYLDGTSDASGTQSLPLKDQSQPLYIGNEDGLGHDFDGWIDEVRISNVARWDSDFIPPNVAYGEEPRSLALDNLLLIHSDTTDGSTTFVDSSPLGATVTAHGNVQHDTTQTLGFGTSSILFDGTGDYLSVPSNALYTFGTGSFTIEARVRWSASPATEGIITNRPNGSASGIWAMNTNASSKLTFSSNHATFITGSTTLVQDTDYHLAVVRAGNQLSLYVNGVSDATVVANTTNFSTTAQLSAGEDLGGAADFTGWLKEIRVSKVARWINNFTPPTEPWP